MKALSIQQPWAALIVAGVKPVENRSWRTAHRGPLLIHAGREFDNAAMVAIEKGRHPVTLRPWRPPVLAMQFGGIVGVAEVVDCVESHESEWFSGPFAFVLAGARALPFRAWRGQLGLFDVPDEIAPAPVTPHPDQGALW
jgi:hypothetical protein